MQAAPIGTVAAEQEKMEIFILERVQQDAKLAGTYPPNAETRVAFEAWRKTRCIRSLYPSFRAALAQRRRKVSANTDQAAPSRSAARR